MTERLPAPSSLVLSRESVLADYALGWRSRHASLIGRREVLTGKAKFGIFGDGKEVAQLAMARAFRPGDLRSGYYRDQTFMMAVGVLDLDQFFAQLYADADVEREPASAGRQMNAHFATRMRDADGAWLDLTAAPQLVADLSPTAGQMPRLVGLGLRLAALPRAARARRLHPLLARRRRDRLRHHRQRHLRRGALLGGAQRHRRAARAGADLDLGRRLRHLGAQRVPDSPRATSPSCSPASAAQRGADEGIELCASPAGTTRRWSTPTRRRPTACAATTCRRSSTSPS